MNSLVDVTSVDDLTPGTMTIVKAGDIELLLARVADDVYAADPRCPHMGGHLAAGTLEGTVVTCPRHGSRFDLRDGQVVRWTEFSGLGLRVAKTLRSPRPLVTYRVVVENRRVLVDLGPGSAD